MKNPSASQTSPLPWSSEKLMTDLDSLKDATGEQIVCINSNDADLIVRRVNQGPAFDAMAAALDSADYIIETRCKKHDPKSRAACCIVRDEIRAALTLAKESR